MILKQRIQDNKKGNTKLDRNSTTTWRDATSYKNDKEKALEEV